MAEMTVRELIYERKQGVPTEAARERAERRKQGLPLDAPLGQRPQSGGGAAGGGGGEGRGGERGGGGGGGGGGDDDDDGPPLTLWEEERMRREDEEEALHGPRLAGDDDEGGAEGAFAPQLRFDEDGNMVVDESSLSVTAGRATRLQHTGQVEDAERLGVTSSSYLSRAPSTSWSAADTAAFYEALRGRRHSGEPW